MNTNIRHTAYHLRNTRGFTVLFAVLVSSLLLAIGLVIFDITYKEVSFSAIARNSDFAIYAADTGIECSLYWDRKCSSGVCGSGRTSAFATSSQSALISSGVICNLQDIAAGPPAWNTVSASDAATTTFTITFAPQPYCAIVTVAKWGNPSNTSVTARGYNTCLSGDPSRIERALQANY